MGPPIAGFETFQLIDYAFLATHKDPATGKERRIVFDLGSPKDPERDFPPSTNRIIKNFGGYVNIEKNVSEILVEGGVELESVEAVVWRYVVFRRCAGEVLLTGLGKSCAFRPCWSSFSVPSIDIPPCRAGGQNVLLSRLPSKPGLSGSVS